jgi:hypothetical protein
MQRRDATATLRIGLILLRRSVPLSDLCFNVSVPGQRPRALCRSRESVLSYSLQLDPANPAGVPSQSSIYLSGTRAVKRIY